MVRGAGRGVWFWWCFFLLLAFRLDTSSSILHLSIFWILFFLFPSSAFSLFLTLSILSNSPFYSECRALSMGPSENGNIEKKKKMQPGSLSSFLILSLIMPGSVLQAARLGRFLVLFYFLSVVSLPTCIST